MVYVLPISFVLGELPVVLAWDMGTIPHKYRAGLRSGAHRFDHDLAWTRGRLPHVLRQFLSFRLVPLYVIKDLIIK